MWFDRDAGNGIVLCIKSRGYFDDKSFMWGERARFNIRINTVSRARIYRQREYPEKSIWLLQQK